MNAPMRALRTMSLLVMVLTGGGPAPGAMVLCVTPDGHVAIEPGQERCATPASAGDGHADSEDRPACHSSADAERCCAPCADLPLDSRVLARAHASKNPLEHFAPTAAWIGTAPAPVSKDAAHGFPTTSPPLSSLGGARQTLVLRC